MRTINIQYTLVSDLNEDVDRSWKYDVLAALFDEGQAACISSIPLSNDNLPDEIIWGYDGFGNYSVKSGYRLLRAKQALSAPASLLSFIAEMWAVDVPVKVKVTMWRIANNFLPTFHNLQIRRLPVNKFFPLCQSHGETVEHLMRDCEFVKSVTSRLALLVVSAPTVGSWKDLLAQYFSSLTARNRRYLLVLYWSVWFSRNKLVHDGVRTSTDGSATFVEAFIQEQDVLGHVFPKLAPECVSIWQAPPEPIVKFNFDSTFNSLTGFVTSGDVGRNSQCLIMVACSFPHKNVADAFAAEAYACRQAVSFAKDLGFWRVIIEGDSLTIIKKINSDRTDRSPISPIVHDIKVLSRDFRSISFTFVRREINNTTHVLARECRSCPTPCYWLEETPEATTSASKMDQRSVAHS
ncbi:hypothetical protein V6N11_010512 [Hibiscus sabdariffa]|uniref:RNase H type-1 domain-containing protein n=1 Tax=Hibiscus sabdariffa TaxID=183260 RepID=A0ABR2S5P6_9ROSI